MKPLTILVADDEEAVCSLVVHWLGAAGHTTTAVGSAKEACDAVRKQRYDLVITDVLMPNGDGLDLIAELKKAQPTTRILAISGGGRYIDGNDCLKMARGLGAHAARMKPFSWDELRSGMQEALTPASQPPW